MSEEVLTLNIKELLHNFVKDPENTDNNFKLAIYYDSLGQTASAISYYLRTAERTDFDVIKYQCILRSALCFDSQGCRNFTVKGLLQHALAIMPKRPEAYFLLSRFYEREKNYQDSYLISSLGESIADRDPEQLKLNVDYPGFYGILFEKAVSSWWCGLCDDSRDYFIDLKKNYWNEMDDIHKQSVMNNLESLKVDLNIFSKKKWKNSIMPTMEFTTSIDTKNGCVVDCVFCPQRTLQKSYKGERFLSLENFQKAVDKMPEEIRVTFAGFTEPWLNPKTTEMLLYAHQKGHPISVFTTGIGMNVDDVERIMNIPYAGNPNGGFVLHLPDQERKAKHPITDRYIKVIEKFGEVHSQIQNFTLMCMGTVHESVRHVFPNAPNYEMWSRAGNLLGESIMKPELLNIKDEYKSIYHGEQPMTCGCLEKLYHNIMLPNGDVSLCCMDYGLEHILGNLIEQDYEDVIPEDNTCFNLCRFCENAKKP